MHCSKFYPGENPAIACMTLSHHVISSSSQVGGAKSTRTGILPHHLKSVMGQANLRVARGDLEEAIKICMEIIRQGKMVVGVVRWRLVW